MDAWGTAETPQDGDHPDQGGGAPRPRQPFLRRGEGVARRLTAYQRRKPLLVAPEAGGGRRDDGGKGEAEGEQEPLRGWSDQSPAKRAAGNNGRGADAGEEADTDAPRPPRRGRSRPAGSSGDDDAGGDAWWGRGPGGGGGGERGGTGSWPGRGNGTGAHAAAEEDAWAPAARGGIDDDLLGAAGFDWERPAAGRAASQPPASPLAPGSDWEAREAEEAIELEEFRALEKHILSDGAGRAPAPAAAAPRSEGEECRDRAGGAPRVADAGGALDGSGELDFGDESEWVDAGFSFEPQQQQQQPQDNGAAGPAAPRPQPPAQARGGAAGGSGYEAGGEGGISQPFVRSLFQQAQAGRLPPAASRGGAARPGSGRGGGAGGSGRSGGRAAPPAEAAAAVAGSEEMALDEMRQRLAELEESATAVAKERAALLSMRNSLERAAARLEAERRAWELQRAEEHAALEAAREDASRRLARERRVLEKQSKALLKLPTKKERSAIEALEAQIAAEREEARGAAARHRLTVERLRCQVKSLQDKNSELREEVRWLEQQQISSGAGSKRGGGAAANAQTQTIPGLRPSGPQPPARPHLADASSGAAGASGTLLAALFDGEASADDDAAAAAAAAEAVARRRGGAADRTSQLAGGATVLSLAEGARSGAAARSAPGAAVEPYDAASDWEGCRTDGVGQHGGESADDDDYAGDYAGDGFGAAYQHQQLWHRDGQGWERQQHDGRAGAADNNSGGFSFAPAGGRGGMPEAPSPQPPAWGPAQVRQPAEHQVPGASQRQLQHQHTAVRRTVHPDGKVEEAHADGTRVVRFANETVKVCRPDGRVSIAFRNGDVKRSLPGGAVEYYYAEVATWQVTHPCGLDVFYFPSGQREAHHPDGTKEIAFPDGGTRRVAPDGTECEITQQMLSPLARLPPPARHE